MARSVPPRVDPVSQPKPTPSPIATKQPVAKSTNTDVKDPAKEAVPAVTTQTESNNTLEEPAARTYWVNTTAMKADAKRA